MGELPLVVFHPGEQRDENEEDHPSQRDNPVVHRPRGARQEVDGRESDLLGDEFEHEEDRVGQHQDERAPSEDAVGDVDLVQASKNILYETDARGKDESEGEQGHPHEAGELSYGMRQGTVVSQLRGPGTEEEPQGHRDQRQQEQGEPTHPRSCFHPSRLRAEREPVVCLGIRFPPDGQAVHATRPR